MDVNFKKIKLSIEERLTNQKYIERLYESASNDKEFTPI